MRKFILITAMVLVSATAQAGPSRSLTMASNDETATVAPASSEAAKSAEAKSAEVKPSETPAPAEAAKPVDAPKYVERPAAVEPATQQAKPAAEKSTQVIKTEKPKHRQESTEARVIYELHRHGIYW